MPQSRCDFCFLYKITEESGHGDCPTRRPRRTARPAPAGAGGDRRPPPRLAQDAVPQMRQAHLPLRGRRRAETRPLLVADLAGQGDGQDPGPHRSRRCRRGNAGRDRGVPSPARAGARAGRGQRPDMQCRVIEPEPSDAPTLYLGLDGTGVPARTTEVAGRKGKQPDGRAKTRESKLVVVWSAHPARGRAARLPQRAPPGHPGPSRAGQASAPGGPGRASLRRGNLLLFRRSDDPVRETRNGSP